MEDIRDRKQDLQDDAVDKKECLKCHVKKSPNEFNKNRNSSGL